MVEALGSAEAEEARLQAVQSAAEEADRARAAATAKRVGVEADRRRAEEARMASQHDAISRRPGGKKVLHLLAGTLLERSLRGRVSTQEA